MTPSPPGRRREGWLIFVLVGLAWLGFASAWAWLTYRETLRSFEQDIHGHVAAADQVLSTLLASAREDVDFVASLAPHALDTASAPSTRTGLLEVFVDGRPTLRGPDNVAPPAAAGASAAAVMPRASGDATDAIEWLMAVRAPDERVVTLTLPASKVIAGWGALKLPPGSAITLIADGTMWLRWPHERRYVGLDVSGGPLWTAIRKAGTTSGSTRILPTRTDGIERLVVWQQVSAAPNLTLAAGVAVAEAAAAWRAAYLLPITLTAVGGLVLLGLMLVARARAAGAEAERDLALDEAKTAERRWMLALDAAELGVFDWNPQTGEVWLSPRFSAMLGYRDGEFGSSYADWERRVHPDDLPGALADIESHLRGRTPAYRNRHRLRAADGSWRWTIARGQVVARDAQGRAVRMVGTQVDVTAPIEADELRRQRDHAESASKAKSEFMSRMSHELRTPLNAVIGFAQLMAADDPPMAAPQRERLQHILESSEHLLALIGDLLDLSRIEAGELAVDAQPLDAAEHAVSVVGELQTVAARSEVRLLGPGAGSRADARVGPRVGVMADSLRLRQVLLNLAGNGIKYNRAGGTVRIEVGPHDAGDSRRWTRIEVIDDGPGLDASQMAHLFEPFNRLGAERGPVEGTGIGLTISRQLVERMGGRIEVQSTPGQGSRFAVVLPGCDAPAAAPGTAPTVLPAAAPGGSPPPAPSPAQVPAAGVRSPLSVVYVEDHEVNVLLVQQMSSRRPDVVLEIARSGQEALELVRRSQPDLMLVDMNLGDMTGLELIARLRAEPSTAGIACIALSADAMPDQIEAALQAGFIEYLTKPLKLAALMAVYERAAT